MAAVALALALWEFLNLGNATGEWSRRLAQQARVYSFREPAQRAATALAAALGAGVAAAIWKARASSGARMAAAAALLGAALCVMGALSLHSFDRYAAASVGGWPALQAAKVALAALALVGLGVAWRRGVSPR